MATTYTSDAVTAGLLPYSVELAPIVLGAIEDRTMLSGLFVNVNNLFPASVPRGMPTNGVIRLTIDMPAPLMASTAETTDSPTATTIVPTKVDVSFGQYAIAFESSDQLRLRDATGVYQLPALAAKIVLSAQKTLTSLIAALAGSLTQSVGVSGDPPTWELVRQAADNNVVRGLSETGDIQIAILHPRQWALIRQDLASATGARAQRRDLDAAQMARQVGFQGLYDDIAVWTVDAVAESSGDYTGMVVAPAAIGWGFIPAAPASQSEIRVLDVGIATAEEVRDAANKSTKLNGHAMLGVAILRDDLGTAVVSTGSASLA